MSTDHEDPRVIRSRALILTAAAQVFLEHGFTATTVEQVADVAGVAKRTIYNLYRDKDALFRATILRSIDIADHFTESLAAAVRDVVDPVSDLPSIGATLAETVLSGSVLPLRRLLVMESARFPDLAAEYHRRAPQTVMRALAKLFTQLAERGHLRAADAVLMSEHFAFLVMGADLDRGMFDPQPLRTTDVRRRARAGVDVFLRAYAVPNSAGHLAPAAADPHVGG